MTPRCMSLAECVKALEGSRRSKYGNRKTEYGGRVYDSAREAAYARELDLRKRAGEIRDWRPQPRIPLVVNGVKVCEYRADFLVTLVDGSEELHEVKGYETREWTLKRRLLEALHPERRLVVVR